jgi:hypothetical protein
VFRRLWAEYDAGFSEHELSSVTRLVRLLRTRQFWLGQRTARRCAGTLTANVFKTKRGSSSIALLSESAYYLQTQR